MYVYIDCIREMSSFSEENVAPLKDCYMDLALFVIDGSEKLVDRYKDSIRSHNEKVSGSLYPDAGFDLFSPVIDRFEVGKPKRHHLNVKCRADMVSSDGSRKPTGFLLYPRSSISKTPLRLSNSVGVIDSGYRGELMCAFDCFYRDYIISDGDRLMQIVAPGMVPIVARLVDKEEDLGDTTDRGSGGFGSTGC